MTPADFESDGPLRILGIGAHPDDCEFFAGGVAAKWTAMGHEVKFVSMTQGDLGHWATVGTPLARRRADEKRRCAEILGTESVILENRDGELEPTLENRKAVVRLIREWRADVVMSHRPNDYHPDHRATGALVQDAAYMVTVPFYCPDAPHLRRNPLFLFFADEFTRPVAFRADVAVAIDDVIEKKLSVIEALESQFYEGGCEGSADLVPRDPGGRADRRRAVRREVTELFETYARDYRPRLAERYGAKEADAIRFAEVFEICEYGRSWASISRVARRSGEEEIRRLFPFFPARPEVYPWAGRSAP